MSWTLEQAAQIATIAGFVIASISFGALVYPAIRYVRIRSSDLRQREFENYHRLIRDLARGGKQVRLASQTAIIFELRNYPNYAAASLRILRALQEGWTRDGKTQHSAEMGLTLAFLERIENNR